MCLNDWQALSQGGKYEIFEESGSAHLEIYESEVCDSGEYRCTAANSCGAASTSCTVTVRGKKHLICCSPAASNPHCFPSKITSLLQPQGSLRRNRRWFCRL